MSDQFLQFVEQHKDLVKPETYENLKKYADKLSDDQKQKLMRDFKTQQQVVDVVEDFDKKRVELLEDAVNQFKQMEDDVKKEYDGIMKNAEAEEKKHNLEEVEKKMADL